MIYRRLMCLYAICVDFADVEDGLLVWPVTGC